MSIVESLPDSFVPAVTLAVNYAPLPPPIARRTVEVSVTEYLSPPNQFRIRVDDPDLSLISAARGPYTEGSRVEISMGYQGNTVKMMVGEIAAVAADFPTSGPATVQVEGYDLLHRLTRGTAYRGFSGAKPNTGTADSEIVSLIASEMQLTPSVDSTPSRTVPRVQDHVTNLAFLEELSHANGYFLWVDGDTLNFKHDRPVPGTVQLEWGKTLLSFSPRLSTAGQVNAVEVRGWDPIQKQSFHGRGERSAAAAALLARTGRQQIDLGAGGRSERVVVCDAGVASAKEAQALADRVIADQQQAMVTGSGTSVGHPKIHVGTTLKLTGLGRFNGSYMVEEVTHMFGTSGYETSFHVRQQ